ncbi:hypothetical protein MKD33_03975, partial [Chromobacterium piscinae]
IRTPEGTVYRIQPGN